jgi:hypothetical protein
MVCEKSIGKDAEGSDCGIILRTVPAYVRRDEENSEKQSDNWFPGRNRNSGPPNLQACYLPGREVRWVYCGEYFDHPIVLPKDRGRCTSSMFPARVSSVRSVQKRAPEGFCLLCRMRIFRCVGRNITILDYGKWWTAVRNKIFDVVEIAAGSCAGFLKSWSTSMTKPN